LAVNRIKANHPIFYKIVVEKSDLSLFDKLLEERPLHKVDVLEALEDTDAKD
jgi:hypothetical protein